MIEVFSCWFVVGLEGDKEGNKVIMDDVFDGMEIEDEVELTEGLDEGFELDNFLAGRGTMRYGNVAESSSSGQGGTGVNLNLTLGDGPSSSSSAAVPDRDVPDHDSHNKRPKVHSFTL